jgi:hypothetical protein
LNAEFLRKRLQAFADEERAQALTEFVIVAPLFIVMLFFSWYFSDLVQLRLDTQEIARLAAWEPTNRPMHDYLTGDHEAKQNNAKEDGANKLRELYRDLDVAIDEGQMPRKLTIDRTLDNLEIKVADGPRADGPMGENYPKQGVVEGIAETTASGITDFFPHNMLVGSRFRTDPFGKMRDTLRFKDTYQLLTSSWRLHDGQDVLPGQGDKAYTKQLDRVAWFTQEMTDAKSAFDGIFGQLQPLTGTDNNPFETVVSSRNYVGDAASGRRTQAHGLKVSGGQNDFDTAPMRTEDRDGNGSNYGKTLAERRDKYLGCKTLKDESECWQ